MAGTVTVADRVSRELWIPSMNAPSVLNSACLQMISACAFIQRASHGKVIVLVRSCEYGSFLTTSPGFGGILKHRFADFHVREIAVDGTVLRLDDVPDPHELVDEVRAAFHRDPLSFPSDNDWPTLVW